MIETDAPVEFKRARSCRRAVRGLLFCACLGFALGGETQTPPTPPRLGQDVLDLLGRSSVVQGSGARAFGMGGAFLARPDDATAASWNPAGLSYLRRPELSLVVLGDSSLATREYEAGSDLPSIVDLRSGQNLDFVAFTFPINLGSLSGAAQVSHQRVFPFDGQRNIERPNGLVRVDSEGGFDVLAVGTGMQLSRRLRLGATLNRWRRGYTQDLERRTALSSRQTLSFQPRGWNVNAGAIWSPRDNVNLGFVFKTSLNAQVEMVRTRQDVAEVPTDSLAPAEILVVDNAFRSDVVRLHLPAAFGFGISWRPASTLTLSVDYTRSFWSRAGIDNYFTLPPCPVGRLCPDPEAAVQVGVPQPGTDLFEHLRYPALDDTRQSDTAELRAGVERVLIFAGGAKVPLRAGLFRDRQYFLLSSGGAPASAGFTLGLGLVAGPLLFDVAYVRESARYRDSTPDPVQVRVVSQRLYISTIFRMP